MILFLALSILFAFAPVDAQEPEAKAPVVEKVPNIRWNHESSLGIVVTGGNTNLQTASLGQVTRYKYYRNNVTFRSQFLASIAGQVLTARQWSHDLKYVRDFEKRFGVYAGVQVEGDTFAGFPYRINNDIGGKFYIMRYSKGFASAELGYRYAYETHNAGEPTQVVIGHIIRTFLDISHKLNTILAATAWIEALPDLSDSEDFRLNFEPGLRIHLMQHLSLKLGLLGKFDNKPALEGNEQFDFTYTTTFVAGF